ncbi:CU044_5270 family protein [Nonomuraea sp. NN258]|uniref:CU044_5270 family protein n=1 Tax=Nonomuraea antri TaxID=2730852 RepID=UPI00156964EB|nr:CU044_5270 family protein [Nonomuraea antri]NRQ38457.1 CU044_5270 family protein [Nonomuraea antri]
MNDLVDDIKALRSFRGDAPEPDAARLAALRDRLATTTATATAPGAPAPRSAGRRAPFARRALLSGALAAAVAAAVLLTAPDATEPAPGGTPSTAVAEPRPGSITLLEQAALVAERRSFSAPRPDQWVYTRTKSIQPADGAESIMEGWIRYDGKQLARVSPRTGQLRVEDVPPDPGDDDLSPQQYHHKLLALPTDPVKLLAKVTKDRHWIDYPKEEAPSRQPNDERAFRVLTLYLGQQAVMPPRLEAAIYRALARIPGVKVATGVRDAMDREGLAIYYEPKGQGVSTRYFVLDPQTYRLLGERTVWHRDEWWPGSEDKAPKLIFRAGSQWAFAKITSAIVDRAGDRR